MYAFYNSIFEYESMSLIKPLMNCTSYSSETMYISRNICRAGKQVRLCN